MSVQNIPNRNNWNFTSKTKLSKKEIINLYVSNMLRRTQEMFKYVNLPKTIPIKDLEFILQTNGNVTIAKVNDNLYALRGGLGGEPNEYYLPTISIISNPYLKYNASLKIDKECVVILNDSLYQGLLPLIQHNANLLTECDISFRFGAINSRIPALISSTNDDDKYTTDEFFKQVEEGEKLGSIVDKSFIDKLGVYDYANKGNNVINLIELKQYILGLFYQDLGVQAPFNMKRETLSSSENELTNSILIPLCDNMLEMRKIGIEKVNKMFSTNISVDFSSVWADLRKERNIELKRGEDNE